MEAFLGVLYLRALRRERRFRDRLDLLALTDQELMKHYRFPRHELIELIEELVPQLRRRTRRTRAIPPHTQVLLALRILASGSFQHVIGDTTDAGNGTASSGHSTGLCPDQRLSKSHWDH
ncbi:putative nuclease HARBI1 [Chionoecetes opilio]|uniref:Putative nuclease HARBI1 n=1 Tax=Chionoecetes opilio TaxID=41210 RepID=A0A8J5CN70_CHIOP|nr:putative nuclease HARBI1 [Chionoecetes opilio]